MKVMTFQGSIALVITDLLEVESTEDHSFGWDASEVIIVGHMEAHSLL